MKHKGSKFEYEDERDKDLMRAYHEQLESCDTIVLSDIFRKVVAMPSERFWVSEERAAIVIGSMLRGNKLEKMRHNAREMYFEIYKRVLSEREKYPDKSIGEIVFHVIRQPAPKFYLTPDSARVIVTRIKREKYSKVFKRLRHMFNSGGN